MMKKYLALKIDVDTLRGTQVGVPALVTLLKKYQAGATFLFSLGPDHTGRAIKRVFRKGFLGQQPDLCASARIQAVGCASAR